MDWGVSADLIACLGSDDPALITQLPLCVAEALGPDPTAFAQLTGRQRRLSLFHGSDYPVAQ
ncbi:MAG: hypothetical protein PHC78_08250 [Verrucomicrobiota bacterium]|nr:hypothetical protein [Verrucomicrobiota bacterium]